VSSSTIEKIEVSFSLSCWLLLCIGALCLQLLFEKLCLWLGVVTHL
jgi:hypothetical protein